MKPRANAGLTAIGAVQPIEIGLNVTPSKVNAVNIGVKDDAVVDAAKLVIMRYDVDSPFRVRPLEDNPIAIEKIGGVETVIIYFHVRHGDISIRVVELKSPCYTRAIIIECCNVVQHAISEITMV